MGIEEFRKILKYDQNIMSGICGGEPTIHPQFCDFMDEALKIRGKHINLLTNGMWPDHVIDFMEKMEFSKTRRVSILFNLLNPQMYSKAQLEKIKISLSIVNHEKTYVGFTIYKKSFDYSYILNIAEEFNIRKIRYSIAAPNITDPRTHNIDPDRDFKDMAKLVYQFVKEAIGKGFEVYPDCGYLPPCAYEKDELLELMLMSKNPAVAFRCDSLCDIGQNGESWRCYSLYSLLKANTKQFDSAQELTNFYDKKVELLLNNYVFEKCETCEYRLNDICHGGCYGYHVIKNKADNYFLIDYNESTLDCIPVVNRDTVNIWNKNGEDIVYVEEKLYQLHSYTIEDAFEKQFILSCDSKKSIGEILSANDVIDKEVCIEKIKKLFYLGIIKLKIIV
jgi:radical SAM protein with 4Fe4S-binding SPASM domain